MYTITHRAFDELEIVPVKGNGKFVVKRAPEVATAGEREWRVYRIWMPVDDDLTRAEPFPTSKGSFYASANEAAQWCKDYITETHEALAAEAPPE